jgi:type IV pilus assembly protein PilM
MLDEREGRHMRSLIRAIIPVHTYIGVEITDLQVKMCETYSKGSSIKVTNSLIHPLPEGTMNDGRIQDKTALQQTIQKMLVERKWRTRHVHFAIPSQSVMIRMMKLPAVSKAHLTKLIEFEMKHNVHLPFEDPYYDFIVMKQTTDIQATAPNPNNASDLLFGNGSGSPTDEVSPDRTCDVMLVAAPSELLNQYVQLFKDLDLRLNSMEIKSLSIIRTLEYCYQNLDNKIMLLVDVNEASCDLTIIENQSVKITRNVQTSFVSGQIALEPTGTDLNSLFNEFKNEDHVFDSASSDLISEMERLMNFYRYSLNSNNQQVDYIYVCGDVDVEKLIDLMRQRMTQQIVKFKWSSLNLSQEAVNFDILPHIVTLGLSLRGKR